MRKNKGFTLMELLIVVAVIAILIAIALPTFRNAQIRSNENADIQAVSALYTDLQAKYEIYGKIPSGTETSVYNMKEAYNKDNERAGELGDLIPADGGWTKGGSVTISVDNDGKFTAECK